MKKLAMLVILVMMIPVISKARGDMPDNGNTWNQWLTSTDKVDYVHAYITGFLDGWLSGLLKAKPHAHSLTPPPFISNGNSPMTMQTVLGVDELYKHPANRSICINHAVLRIAIKLTHPNADQKWAQISKLDAENGCGS